MASNKNVKIKASFSRENVIAEDKKKAAALYDSSRFGEMVGKEYHYSLVEACYLIEKGKINVYDGKKKRLSFRQFINKARKVEPNFWVRYCVFKDIRDRGYIIKTALKFGADFRVYDRGIKPGEDHAKWIVFPAHEGEVFTGFDFAAKNRVAHSTKKTLLLAIVDAEGDVTFYECRWIRP